MSKEVHIDVYMTPSLATDFRAGKVTQDEILNDIKYNYMQREKMKKTPAPRRAQVALNVIDQLMMQSFVKYEGPVPQCKAGCAFCCYNNVDITWDEAAMLIEKYGKQIDWTRVETQLMGIPKIPYKMRACVFLDEETKTCTVYEDRPLSCRKYLVVSDPEKCNSEIHPNGDVEVVTSGRSEMFASSMMSIQDNGPMPEMLIKVRDNMRKNGKILW